MDVKAPDSVARFWRPLRLTGWGRNPWRSGSGLQFPRLPTHVVREINEMNLGGFEFHGTAETWANSQEPKNPQIDEYSDSGSEQNEAHVRNSLSQFKQNSLLLRAKTSGQSAQFDHHPMVVRESSLAWPEYPFWNFLNVSGQSDGSASCHGFRLHRLSLRVHG